MCPRLYETGGQNSSAVPSVDVLEKSVRSMQQRTYLTFSPGVKGMLLRRRLKP